MSKKAREFCIQLAVMVALIFFYACNKGTDPSSSREAQEDTASLVFTIDWMDVAPEPGTTARDAIDCVGRDVATIEASLYTAANEMVATRAWPCDAHGGTLEEVPAPQNDISLVLVGKNNDGEIAYRGAKGGLAIQADMENQAGVIDIFRFIPPSVTPGDHPNMIQWNPVEGASSYRITISPSEDFSNPTIDDRTTEPAFSATGLAPGTVHYVRVYARDDVGNESAGSESATFTTLPLAAVPQNVSARGGLKQVVLSWEGESDGRYNLYWSTAPGVSTAEYEGKIEDYEGTTFVHEDLQDNTIYYYVVTAQNGIGQESDISAEVSATAVGVPIEPSDLSATAGERRVTLNWTAAPGFVYNVYWSTETGVSTSDYEEKVTGINTGRFVHRDRERFRYYSIVTAENDLGESEPSNEVSAAPGWMVLEGGEAYEYAMASALDADGNSYVLGQTLNGFEAQSKIGEADILLLKYDRQGARQWAKLLGTTAADYAQSIDVDGSGNLYLLGATRGEWENGHTNGGHRYIFIIKFDSEGVQQWISYIDTASASYDVNNYLAVDSQGNSYITGWLEQDADGFYTDVFITKFDTEGNQAWIQTLASAMSEKSYGIALDDRADYCYVTGYSEGDLEEMSNHGQKDAFIAKYATSTGDRVWLKLWGDEYSELGYAIIADGEACYLSGLSRGVPFIARYDAAKGNQEWLTPLEAELELDAGQKDLVFLPDGNLLLGANSTSAGFDGQPNLGGPNQDGEYPYDIIIMGYDAEDGTRLWTRRHGGSEDDFLDGISVGTSGYYHISGNTNGDLGSQTNAGGMDIFTWKISFTP
ncbi:MAG: SBBP repeat-containing protein [Desulfosarcinaceae bacterium]